MICVPVNVCSLVCARVCLCVSRVGLALFCVCMRVCVDVCVCVWISTRYAALAVHVSVCSFPFLCQT